MYSNNIGVTYICKIKFIDEFERMSEEILYVRIFERKISFKYCTTFFLSNLSYFTIKILRKSNSVFVSYFCYIMDIAFVNIFHLI